jgi:hypothetical protein
LIQHIKHQEIDKVKWDTCIARSVNGLIYAYSWYLDIAAPGWEALVNEDYSQVLPITFKNKYGINYIYPPYFIQQLGLFSTEKINEKRLIEFLKALPSKFKFIEYNLNTENNFFVKDFTCTENLTHHLKLNSAYEKIYSFYSENLKRNLKKAKSSGLEFDKNIEVPQLIKIFRANRGSDIENLKTKDYQTLSKLIAEAEKQNAVEIIGTRLKEKLCAGAIFLKSNNKFIFIFSATDPVAREKGAMPFIIDNFIREHSQSNSLLDFEGSNNSSLARFYSGFGAEKKTYLQIKRNLLPIPLKWIKR